jgi:hypothetical protein
LWPDQVDLHDHCRRPRQSLVHAEEQVRGDDPGPRRRPDQQERHRQSDQPAGDEDRLATEAVGKRASDEVRAGLREPERQEKRQHGRGPGESEDVGRENWQNGPLLPGHPADKSRDRNQQSELAEVRPEAEPERRGSSSLAYQRGRASNSCLGPLMPLNSNMPRST